MWWRGDAVVGVTRFGVMRWQGDMFQGDTFGETQWWGDNFGVIWWQG